MFVWTDIETTGLDPRKEALLAIGIIITDDAFREVARKEWYVGGTPRGVLAGMSQYVRDMHTRSGLLARCSERPTSYCVDVERDVAEWLREHLGPRAEDIKQRPVMAGNTVHFDKGFLAVHMPEVLAQLHYRLLDVSTLKVLCMATVPGAAQWESSRPEALHTPLADLDNSLAELAHWREALAGGLP